MTSRFVLRASDDVGFGEGEVRVLKGDRISEKRELLRQLGHALRFPDYFGLNWDAFQECLSDAAAFNDPGVLRVRLEHSESVRRHVPGDFDMLLLTWAESAPVAARDGLDLKLILA